MRTKTGCQLPVVGFLVLQSPAYKMTLNRQPTTGNRQPTTFKVMIEGIAFLIVLLLIGGALVGLMTWLANVDRKRAEMTEEEYENRERSPNLFGTGMMAFDEMIRPNLKKASEYRMDAEQGHLPGGDHEGEPLEEKE